MDWLGTSAGKYIFANATIRSVVVKESRFMYKDKDFRLEDKDKNLWFEDKYIRTRTRI